MIRVLIVDDRASARVALRLRLAREPDIDVVGEADGAQDAIFEARISKPDVILLDAQVSENTEVEPMGRLLQETPTAKVIVLSRDDDPTYVLRAFAAGASGFASQAAVEAEIVAAVREVAGGGRYVSQTLGARLIAAEAGEQDRTAPSRLSEREGEVLRLLALGHTNKEIAELLHISVRTVESHRTRIMQKLSLNSRADLVRHALDVGLLTGSE